MTKHYDTTNKSFFELRFDIVAHGVNVHELLDWYRHELFPLEGAASSDDRCMPLRCWSTVAGAHGPGLLSLYRWDRLQQREDSLGKLLQGRKGQELFDQADGRRLLRAAESWILTDISIAEPLAGDHGFNPGEIHEIRIQQITNTTVPDMAVAFVQHEFPALRMRGARIVAFLDLVIGPSRPTLVMILAWPAGCDPVGAWLEMEAEMDRRPVHEHGRIHNINTNRNIMQYPIYPVNITTL